MALISCSITVQQGNQGVVPINPNIDIVELQSTAGAGSACTLPPGSPGNQFRIINNSGSSAKVFPSAGDLIAAEAVNVAITIPASTGRSIDFTCYAPGKWSMSDVQWR